MAANLLIETPEAYAGLIMIGGCFAVEDDALPAGALAGKQVLVCRGRSDDIMPRHKFEQAASYLTGSSGARTTILGYDSGHELPLTIKSSVQRWLNDADRCTSLSHRRRAQATRGGGTPQARPRRPLITSTA